MGKRKRTCYAIAYTKGRNVRQKLGEWPYVKAKNARSLAVEFLGRISRGLDPRRAKGGTLENALEDYIEDRTHASRGTLSEDTADQYRRALMNHCHRWMSLDVSTITLEDIKVLHRRLRDKPYMANQVVRALRSILAHAEHPIAVPKRLYYTESKRENRIEDLTNFFEKVEQIGNPSRRALWKLGCLTGIRRETLLGLRWDQIEDDTVHLSKMKNGPARDLPPSRQATVILEGQRGLSEEWVLPSFSGGTHLVEARDPILGNIRPHDTQRVFTEACAAVEMPEHWIKYLRGDAVGQDAAHGYMTRQEDDLQHCPLALIALYKIERRTR